jgi:LPS export ABC transporter permease LptF/LPS export ABC transporter permease LptG
MRLLDRYIVREMLPPFAIALLVFTFVLIIPFIIEMAEQLIAKGVPWLTLLRLTATLVPQALGLTIPMAFLLAILVALGRLSADREVMVLMACGVSPFRMMRPVLILAVLCWAATSWVMIEAIPNENQNYREITMRIIADRAEGQVRPREFFEDFPDTVLYVREVPPGAGWVDVFAANTRNPAEPEIFIASRGRMVVNREKRTIEMVLEDGARHRTKASEPATYEVVRFQQTILNLNPDAVFPRTGPARGDRELSIGELQQKIAEFQANGLSPHNQIIEIHKKFSIPIACFVFAFVGLGLGISNRRDGKLASFVLGIGVIFIYYIVMFGAHSMTKGGLMPAWLAMWVPNIVLGGVGLVLVWSRATAVDAPIRIALPLWLAKRLSNVTGSADRTDAPRAPLGARPFDSAQGKRTRPVIVIRIPRLNFPRPNLLDLYISRLYLRILVMATAGMAGLFYISTFIDLSDKWFKGQTTLGTLVAYLGWETPQFMAWILAIAVLLSALVTIGLLTKSSELIVMRACGVSLYRTAVPLLLFGVIAGAFLFALEERVLSVTNRRASYLKHLIRTGSPQTFDVLNRKWLMGRNGEIYRYEYYDPRRQELNGLSVFEFDPATRALVRRTFATRAAYEPRAPQGDGQPWVAHAGWQRQFAAGDVTTFDQYQTARLPLEPSSYFVTEAPAPDRMNFAQLKAYIATLMASGYNVLEYEVGLHRKIAYPFVAVIMTLIAVPFAVTTGRRGAMYGVGVGIVLALVYWTMISIFAAVGSAGVIPPLLAAWAPNLIFGAAAAYLLLTVRT